MCVWKQIWLIIRTTDTKRYFAVDSCLLLDFLLIFLLYFPLFFFLFWLCQRINLQSLYEGLIFRQNNLKFKNQRHLKTNQHSTIHQVHLFVSTNYYEERKCIAMKNESFSIGNSRQTVSVLISSETFGKIFFFLWENSKLARKREKWKMRRIIFSMLQKVSENKSQRSTWQW